MKVYRDEGKLLLALSSLWNDNNGCTFPLHNILHSYEGNFLWHKDPWVSPRILNRSCNRSLRHQTAWKSSAILTQSTIENQILKVNFLPCHPVTSVLYLQILKDFYIGWLVQFFHNYLHCRSCINIRAFQQIILKFLSSGFKALSL